LRLRSVLPDSGVSSNVRRVERSRQARPESSRPSAGTTPAAPAHAVEGVVSVGFRSAKADCDEDAEFTFFNSTLAVLIFFSYPVRDRDSHSLRYSCFNLSRSRRRTHVAPLSAQPRRASEVTYIRFRFAVCVGRLA